MQIFLDLQQISNGYDDDNVYDNDDCDGTLNDGDNDKDYHYDAVMVMIMMMTMTYICTIVVVVLYLCSCSLFAGCIFAGNSFVDG